ncbi:MAG TPA: phosphotransferase family protein [Ktedonobacterales bacterium]
MVDEQHVRQHLALVCASLFCGGVAVTDIIRITTGWETDIFAFTLRHGATLERAEAMILRLYSGDDAPEKAERECAVMRALHAAGYPVPQVWMVETAHAPLGAPFLLMERIDGPLLLDAFVGGDESRRQELLMLFCRMLAGLHALDWRMAPPALASWTDAVRDPTDPYAFIDTELAMLRVTLERFPVAQPLASVLRWLEVHRDDVPCRRLALTHGDYHPNNVLLRPDGSAVVIDWGAAQVADPRRDLAWTLLLTSTQGYAELYEPMLRGYEQAGGVVEQLGYFEVMAACRRLFDALVSLHSGADTLGMRPGTEELMRRQGAHFRRVYALLQDRTDGVGVPEIERFLGTLG